MTEIWVWNVWAREAGSADDGMRHDVAGYRVEASDGHIGEVDEAVYDEGSGRLIVDTGFWIFGKRRMIPAGLVVRVDDARTVHLACPKATVKDAPDYDAERADSPEHRTEVADAFAPSRYTGMTGDPIGPQAGPRR